MYGSPTVVGGGGVVAGVLPYTGFPIVLCVTVGLVVVVAGLLLLRMFRVTGHADTNR